MHKWTKWLTTVAVLSLVMVVSLLAGCAPSKPAAAPAPAPAPAPQPTVQPPTPAPPAAKGTADLVIKDLWQEQSQVYYKVANLGNGVSQGGTARLYVEGQERAHDYIEPLAAGQEVQAVFHGWSFTAAQALEAGPEKGMDIARPSVLVRVCLDTEDTTKESNEANNCMEKPLGMPYVFDFALYATTAEWKSGNDPLKWPMAPTDVHGAAFISNYRLEDGQFYSGALAMYPKHVSNGSIQGLFGEPYSKYAYSGITTKDIEMPPDAKFTAKVGFKEGAKTDGVTVSFGYFEPSLNLVWLKSAKVQYDGKLDDFQVDLSSLVGKKVKFILKVDAGNSWEDDFFTLVGPKITQWL